MNNGFLTVREESEKWVCMCKRGEETMGFHMSEHRVKNGFLSLRRESEEWVSNFDRRE